MDKHLKKLKEIKAVQSIEANYKTMDKPCLKVVASKSELKDGDLDLIFELLNKQNNYAFSFELKN